MRRFAFVLGLTLPLLAGEQAARVDLPLEKYEALRKPAPAVASATVVGSARFTGRFGGALLFVADGRSIGTRPEVPLLSDLDGFALHGCRGPALVRRAEEGKLFLLPLAESFRVTCAVAIDPGRERVSFTAAASVLHVEAALPDGRLERGEECDEGRAVALLRTIASRQVLPVTATGRYRITLLPDEVSFRYELALHNPNRDRSPFALPLPNGERVERTEPVVGEESAEGWAMDAPVGDSTLLLTGRLPGTRFVPPLEGAAQMLLVETHPLVKADLEGPSRRVSPAEVGVATEYRGGRGFLLKGREAISWTTSVVEALRTGDVVVQRAEHGLYLARDGGLIAETRLDVANQGAPELVVHVKDPLWAGVGGRPVLLMPEKDGIRLPLDPGSQRVEVQHRARVGSFLGLLAARVPLLTTPAETGHQRVTLALPAGWLPLAAAFGSARRVPALPPPSFFVWLLVLVLAAERALAPLIPPGRARWLLALALGAAGMTSPGAFWVVAGACLAVGLLRLLARLREGSLTFGRALALSVALLALVGVLAWRSATRDSAANGAGGLGAVSGGGMDMSVTGYWQSWGPRQALTPPTMADALPAQTLAEPMLQRGIPTQSPPSASAEYRGLPVRREIPFGERWLVLDQPAGGPARLAVLLVSSAWLGALRAALLATAALLLVRRRAALGRRLAHAWREAGEGIARAARRPTAPAPAAP